MNIFDAKVATIQLKGISYRVELFFIKEINSLYLPKTPTNFVSNKKVAL